MKHKHTHSDTASLIHRCHSMLAVIIYPIFDCCQINSFIFPNKLLALVVVNYCISELRGGICEDSLLISSDLLDPLRHIDHFHILTFLSMFKKFVNMKIMSPVCSWWCKWISIVPMGFQLIRPLCPLGSLLQRCLLLPSCLKHLVSLAAHWWV